MCLLDHLAGAFTHQPRDPADEISEQAGDPIKRSFDYIDPAQLLDYHTHVADPGTGSGLPYTPLDNLGRT